MDKRSKIVLAMMLLSLFLLGVYFVPTKWIVSPTEGLMVASSPTVRIQWIILTLLTEGPNPQLDVSGQWVSKTNPNSFNPSTPQSFNVSVVLPFVITSIEPAHERPHLHIWNYSVMDRASSVIFATITNKTDFFFEARFDVAKTFVSVQKGRVTIEIPLYTGTSTAEINLFNTLDLETQVPELEIRMSIPVDPRDVQAFPQPFDQARFLSEANNGPLRYYVSWKFGQYQVPEGIMYSYLDSNLESIYDIALIVGSVLLGSGVSGAFELMRPNKKKR